IRLARQLTLATEEPEARGLLALMLLNHARLPARLDAEGRIVTLDRQDGGRAATRSRPRSLPCTTMLRAPGRPTGRRSSPGTTTSSRSPWTPCARTPPRYSAARSRSVMSSAPPPGCAKQTGCATCSARGTGGTPSAATCTNSTATCPPPPRPTPRPLAGLLTSESATTWSARPPAREPPRPRQRLPRGRIADRAALCRWGFRGVAPLGQH